ncbi:MAG: hypothetical protein R3C05_13160 [Pirellulaceae bacterium]
MSFPSLQFPPGNIEIVRLWCRFTARVVFDSWRRSSPNVYLPSESQLNIAISIVIA